MTNKPVLLCDLPHKNSEYYPTKDGVFVEEDRNIYLCKPDEDAIFFCKVDNLTWQANDFGVYFKDTKENKIIHIDKPNGKRNVICKTKDYFWAPHNRGGVFVFDDKLGILSHFGNSEALNISGGEKTFLEGIIDYLTPKKRMFDHDQFVSLCHTRLFYPYENGYFYCKNNEIYFYNATERTEVLITRNPDSSGGKWNAYAGQVYKNIGTKIFFCSNLLDLGLSICETEFTSFKGSQTGVIVCKNYKELWHYPKAKEFESMPSATNT